MAERFLLILAAVIPSILLLALIYRQDRVDAEPPGLLARLLLLGAVATFIARWVERLGLGLLPVDQPLHDLLLCFAVVGPAEEGTKFALLNWATWDHPHFNSRFDGVVYAVFISLGFALWENLGYVFNGGLYTALLRAFTAIPGHACFGVFMGCLYAWAAFTRSRAHRAMALIVPVVLHGAYDYLAAQVHMSPGMFLAFVGMLFALTLRLVRRMSAEDEMTR